MKKLVLGLIAVLMVISSARADGGDRRGGTIGIGEKAKRSSSGTVSVGEFFCAIAGGFAGGAIVKHAGGGDPVTFIGALIGGLIGVNFCQYLNDPVAQGLQQAAREGLDNCGREVKWRGNDYYGTLKVLAQGYHKNHNSDLGTENICKYFETSIYENNGRRVARTKAWACKNPTDQWNVTHENWVIKEKMTACDGRIVDGGGSVGIIVEPDVRVSPIRNPRWNIGVLTRMVDDYGVDRNMKLARRVCTKRAEDRTNRCLESWSRPELGVFKAVIESDNSSAVLLFESNRRASVLAQIDEVGVECRGTNVCAGLPVDNAQTTDGLNGFIQYLFQNGDIVINDENRGIQIRPDSSLVNYRSGRMN